MLLRRRRAAKSDLVAVWVAEGGFADAVSVGLALGRLQAALGDLGDAASKSSTKRVRDGVPGMLGRHPDEHVPVAGELPHRLGVVRKERRRSAEKPPGRRGPGVL